MLLLLVALLFPLLSLALPNNVTASLRHSIRDDSLATVYTTCAMPNTVALTFDDGPYIYFDDIIKMLSDNQIQATFFFNGNNYQCIYNSDNVQRVQTAIAKGHQIGSHTWSHPHLTTLTNEQIGTEMDRIDDALLKITGLVPAFIRPPYGEYNSAVRSIASSRGQSLVTWDQDSGDSDGASMQAQKKVYSDFVAQKGPQAIFLNHETYESTVHQLIPYAISTLKQAGYEMVTVAECLGLEPYQGAPVAPVARDSSWTC